MHNVQENTDAAHVLFGYRHRTIITLSSGATCSNRVCNNAVHDYTIDGVTSPNVRIIRDLGVIVESKLSFSAHFAHITAKAHQRTGL